jgi:hypothetical protein
MSSMLSVEHSARVTTWDETRRTLHRTKKMSNRTKLACFVAFNICVWALFLSPIILW